MGIFDSVEKNDDGYYTLRKIPSPEDLQKYYAEKYYQDPKGSYQVNYSFEEIEYINNKIEQKYISITKITDISKVSKASLLDIGCGEGWALKYFKDKSWDVIGLDYSIHGCQTHNPDCLSFVKAGDINGNIDLFIEKNTKFDVIWLDNVLEHVVDPYLLLNKCTKLIKNRGVLLVEVPNDFSVLQQHLHNNGYISKPFWVTSPDHISYFNSEGLISIAKRAGWNCKKIMGDFPIDFNLFNEDTNYINNVSVGKTCHKARVAIENFLHHLSPEKTNEFYTILAEMGIGRELIGLFQKVEVY